MIIDCTLREGIQCRDVYFNNENTRHIVRILNELNVDYIECGHPYVSEEEFKRVKTAVEVSKVPVLAHARCKNEDILSVKDAGAEWVGLFISCNNLSLTNKFPKCTRSEVFEIFKKSIEFAKKLGLKVRATVEDAGRTDLKTLLSLFSIAEEAADRICFADSVGILDPWEVNDLIYLLNKMFPKIPIEFHGHNDRGLALSCSIAALKGGASVISSSINGIGERCGITDTLQLMMYLKENNKEDKYKTKNIVSASEFISSVSRVFMNKLAPYVGDNSFTHVAKLHQIAVDRDELSYSHINPLDIQRSSICHTNKGYEKKDFFITPFVKGASELEYHTDGPGTRYVMLDSRNSRLTDQYIIIRKVNHLKGDIERHVDVHRHNCDSIFQFIGDGENYSGLRVEVEIDGLVEELISPATVFIPAGIYHKYRFLEGSGTFINTVNKKSYNDSLIRE